MSKRVVGSEPYTKLTRLSAQLVDLYFRVDNPSMTVVAPKVSELKKAWYSCERSVDVH